MTSLKPIALAGAVCASILAALPTASAQVQWRGEDGPVTIWLSIASRPGEGAWQACRRVYQRDVYQVRRLGPARVRCLVDHSRIYDGGNVRQNFNRD